MINIFKIKSIINDLKTENTMLDFSNKYLSNALNTKELELYKVMQEKKDLLLENYFLKRELESIKKGETNE